MYDYNYPSATKVLRNTRTGSRDVKIAMLDRHRGQHFALGGLGLCLLCLGLEHLASLNVPGCWLDSEVREKTLQLGMTYHRRRTLRETKTTGKAMGNHPGKYVIREISEYAAIPFCGVDMPSRPLTLCLCVRHVTQ